MLIRVVLVVASVLAIVAGCTRADPVPIKKVLVDLDPSAEQALDRERVRALTRAFIERDRAFVLDEKGEGGHVMRVRVYVATSGDAAPSSVSSDEGVASPTRRPALVSLSLDVQGAKADGRTPLRSTGVSHAEGGAPVDGVLADALKDAFSGLVDARVTADEDSEVLISRVVDEGRSVRDREQAIRLLGQRREKTAVPVLLTVLAQGEEVLSPAALVSLGHIADPSTVDAIIEYASGQPAPVRRAAIDAIRSIGTTRGRAWLFTLSTGHPDPDVQLAAATALGVLDARIAGDAPSGEARMH